MCGLKPPYWQYTPGLSALYIQASSGFSLAWNPWVGPSVSLKAPLPLGSVVPVQSPGEPGNHFLPVSTCVPLPLQWVFTSMSQGGGCSCFRFSPHGRPHCLYSLNRFCFDGLLFFFMSWWIESSKDADTSLCPFPQSVHRRHLPMNCAAFGTLSGEPPDSLTCRTVSAMGCRGFSASSGKGEVSPPGILSLPWRPVRLLFWKPCGDRELAFHSCIHSWQSNHFPTEIYSFKMIGKKSYFPRLCFRLSLRHKRKCSYGNCSQSVWG